MRSLDEPIPAQEELYRGISPKDRDGDTVLESAVDVQGTSVIRQKYGKPSDALSPTRLEETEIVVIRAGDAPGPVSAPASGWWEWFLVDDPTEVCVAHAEFRPRRRGEQAREAQRLARGARLPMQKALAERMRLLVRN